MIVAITSLTPRLTLRTPATPAHAAPTTIASNRQNVTCSTAGRRTCVAIPAVEQHGEAGLALDADVEQAHLEPDGDRRRRQHQRHGTARRVEERVAADVVVEHLPVDRERVVPDQCQEHAADARRR